MKKHIMSLVQKEDKVLSIIFDFKGSEISRSESDLSLIELDSGWKEYNPDDLFNSIVETGNTALKLAGLTGDEIETIGISVQRGNLVVWDSKTGKPFYNIIATNCLRSKDICEKAKNDGISQLVKTTSGLEIETTYLGPKMKWVLDNVDGIKEALNDGNARMGSLDSWLLWKLTDGEKFSTDCTNASFSILYNIYDNVWENKLLNYFEIPKDCLPSVELSSYLFAKTDKIYFGSSIMVGCLVEEQHASLFGQLRYDLGGCRAYYNKASKMVFHTGLNPFPNDGNLITTYAYGISGRVKYSLESQWFKYKIEENPKTHPDDLLAYKIYNSVKTAENLTDTKILELRVDGPDSKKDELMQLQADMLQIPVIRPYVKETAALGAAYMAGVATGYFENGRKDIVPYWRVDKKFEPKISGLESEAIIMAIKSKL